MKLTVLDMMKFKNIFVLLLLLSSFCFSQTKNEKEERILQKNFPEKTSLSVSLIKLKSKRILFYKETNNTKISFETKFKFNKHRYSIEFSENGTLEDVEKTLKNDLNEIETFFNKNYDKWSLKKVQKQYIFNAKTKQHIFINNILKNEEDSAFNFEIIAEVKEKKSYSLKEFLFDSKGNHLSTKNIATSSYGHVLY
ncbi:MAG: hypothetical protein ACPG41_00885 [Lacinutrix venerupis]